MAANHLSFTGCIQAWFILILVTSFLNAEEPTEPVPATGEPSGSTSSDQIISLMTQKTRSLLNTSIQLSTSQTFVHSSTSTSSSLSRGSGASATYFPQSINPSSVILSPSIALTDNASSHSLYSRTALSLSQRVSVPDGITPSQSLELSSNIPASSEVVWTRNVPQTSSSVAVVSLNSLSSVSSTPILTSYIGGDMSSTATITSSHSNTIVEPGINSSTRVVSSSRIHPEITPSPSVVSPSFSGITASSVVSKKTIAPSFAVTESINVLSSSLIPGLSLSSTVGNTSLPGIVVSTLTSSVQTVVPSFAASEYVNASLSVSFSSSAVANSSPVIVASSHINKTTMSSVVSKFRNVSASTSVPSFSTSTGVISSLASITPSMTIIVSSVTSALQMSSSLAVLPTTPPVIAPSAPPQNVSAYNISSTSIVITWQTPPADTLNGILQRYEVSVRKLKSPSCQAGSASNSSAGTLAPNSAPYSSASSSNIVSSSSVSTSPTIPVEPTEPPLPLRSFINAGHNLSLTVNNLDKFTCYEVRVRAVTLLHGPWSAPRAVRTGEDVPSQPLNVSVVDKNATSAIIQWKSPAEPNGIILGYRIKYGYSNSSIAIRNVTVEQNSLVLSGLRSYTTYSVQVAAFTRIGNGEYVSELFKTTEAAPSAVRNLLGKAINSSTIKLSWTTPEYPNGPISYVVLIRNTDRKIEVKNTEFTASQLQAATLYTFSVYAQNINHGFTSMHEEVQVQTQMSEPTAPPLDVVALTKNSSSILVTWFPPPLQARHGVITNYIVEYYSATDMDTLVSKPTPDNTTSFTLLSLQPFTKYYVRVRAVNLAGTGPPSEEVTNTTFEGAPSPPTNFSVRSINATSLLASWEQPENPNGALVQYRLYLRQTVLNAAKDRLIYTGEDTMFLIGGLHEFVNYTLTLFAYNVKFGFVSKAVFAMETTHPSAPSGPPQDVQAITLSPHAIRVDWNPPKVLDRNGIITSYILTYHSPQEATKNHTVSGDQRSEVFSHLQPFTRYYFIVQAVNKVGTGPQSPPVQNQTFEDVPGPVVIDHVKNVSSTVLLVSWHPPKHPNGNLLGFSICWHRIDSPHPTCHKVDGAVNSFNVTGLEPMSSYNISITARTAVGSGPVVSSVYRTAEGVPSEPLDLQVWNISATSMTLTWKPPNKTNGILTHYQVFYKPNGSSSVPSFIKPGLNTTVTLHGLHPFTLYDLYVRAATRQGLGLPAIEVVTTDEGRPSEVRYLRALRVESRSVTLKWDPPARPNGHINYMFVYGRLGLPGNTSFCNSTDVDVRLLLPYKRYVFIVSAYNLKYGLNGAATNITTITRPEAPSGPPLNTQLLHKTSETLVIEWDSPAYPNGKILSYQITVTEVENNQRHGYDVDGGIHSYEVKGLLPWHEYTVNIRCSSNGGVGPPSHDTYRTLPSVPPTVPPIKPPDKEVITAHEIIIELEKASDSRGKISFYQVIVLELAKYNNGTPIKPQRNPNDYKPEDLSSYIEAQKQKPKLLPYIAAQFPAKEFSNYKQFKVGNAKNFSVGARKRRDTVMHYYNGPLEPNTFYTMFQRAAVNKDLYTSSKWTQPVSTSGSINPADRTHEPSTSNAGLVAGLCIAFVVIIVIIIVVFSMMWKKKRFAFGMMLDDEGDYSNRPLKLKKIRGSKRRRTSSRGLMGSTDSLDNLDDITRRRQPIPVEHFINHVKRMHIDGDIGFSEEYELVQPNDKEFTWHNSLQPCNKHKNRYANIVAYDHSRVLLTPLEGVQGSDYINANYIDGYNRSGGYIASQGPLPETFDDFWRMIWEQGTATIVMLTQLEERGRRKCDQYWPDRGTQTYGMMRVTASETSLMSYYVLRTFILSHKQEEEEPRQVNQYHFTSWPDHGVPTHPVPLLSLVRTVSNANPSTAGPTVVHCSAGVGRTGTYITLDSTLQRIEREQTIDVFDFVQQMRMKRNLMVQTESQYVFIHDALIEAVSCGVTEFEAKMFGSRLRELREVDPDTGRTYMEKEFLRLLKDERHHSTVKAANMGVNSSKNRYLNILPYEQTRVPLSMRPGEVGSDYINASYIDGYCRRNVYIATQAPLPCTFEDYWRLIWEQGSCVIVMLTNEEEAGKVKCHRYWPSDGTRIFGNILVELTEEVEYHDYVMRQFNLTHAEEKENRVVRQYQYIDWPDVGLPESGVGIIDLIGQVEKWQQQSSNSIITVHCSGGVGRTGVYCAISILIERVKAEGVIDVFQTVQSLRLQRPAMVQTLEQYEFCYSTLQEYLDSFDLYANFH